MDSCLCILSKTCSCTISTLWYTYVYRYPNCCISSYTTGFITWSSYYLKETYVGIISIFLYKNFREYVFAITSLGGQNFENTQISVFSKIFQSTVFFEIHISQILFDIFLRKQDLDVCEIFHQILALFENTCLEFFFKNSQLRVCDKISQILFFLSRTPFVDFFANVYIMGLRNFFRSAFFRDYY